MEKIVGTGGDMMRLRSSSTTTTESNCFSFDADAVYCGKHEKVDGYVVKYFKKLFDALLQKKQQLEEDGSKSTATNNIGTTATTTPSDLMPNVAIVQGDLKITLSKQDYKDLQHSSSSSIVGKCDATVTKSRINHDSNNAKSDITEDDDWMSD
eukprot:11515127-Ditylum_brightwellii.AAC.2